MAERWAVALEMEVRSLLLTLVLMWGQNTAFFLFFSFLTSRYNHFKLTNTGSSCRVC